jgi:hypothetical protein
MWILGPRLTAQKLRNLNPAPRIKPPNLETRIRWENFLKRQLKMRQTAGGS